jgi:hypothetical protein
VLHHNRQRPNRLNILVVQRRCCSKSCDKRVRYKFVAQGGAPTQQENDKETVANFLGSQQKLGRRFKKDASIGYVGRLRMGTKAKSEKKLSFQRRLKRFVEQARAAARICRQGLTETS